MFAKKSSNQEEIFCEFKNITKTFPNVVALNNVSFQIKRSNMHALVGENGAGKTTLMRILMGLYTADEGEIFWQGQKVKFTSPEDAIDKGIMMVAQHSSLIEIFNSLKNLAITKNFANKIIPQLTLARDKLREMSENIGCKLELEKRVDSFSFEDRQRIEVTRALSCQLSMLILDEATSMLTPEESHHLLGVLHSMANSGLTVVFSSHKLDEVMGYADDITVLRQGKVIFSEQRNHTTENELAKAIAGEETVLIEKPEYTPLAEKTHCVLDLRDVWCEGDKGKPSLKGISLRVGEGEIVGIAGSSLSGKRELAECIMNIRKTTKGSVEIDSKIKNAGPIYGLGVSYIPEGAYAAALVPSFSIVENILLTQLDDSQLSKGRFLDMKSLRDEAEKVVREFDVKTPSVDVPASVLSGGNMQKLVVGREFSRRNLKLLIAVNPTSGLDFKTCHKIWRKMLELREEGKAILLISEDLNELKQVSDSIVILYEGEAIGPFTTSKLEINNIGSIMLNGKPESA